MFERYTPWMEQAKTPQRFAEVATKMLARARDMHLLVKIDGDTVGDYKAYVLSPSGRV